MQKPVGFLFAFNEVGSMSATRLFVRPVGEYGTALQPEDYAALERSWISQPIADPAILRRGYH